MKKAAIFLTIILLIASCSSTKKISSSGSTGTGISRSESRKLKKLVEQAEIKKAVESRRYIIKVNRLYSLGGGYFDLVPRSNYLIVNGEIASISLGYMGRSFASRPITGINLNARTSSYRMENNETKGGYKIQMTVKYGSDKFDIFLTIGTEGFCDISINNANIQSVRYTGTIEPIPGAMQAPVLEKTERM